MFKLLNTVLFIMIIQTLTAQTFDVYIGTYTKGTASKGIYHATLDTASGTLSEPEVAAETPDPSFLTFSPDGKFLYATAEGNPGKIRAFEIQQDKKLRFINEASSGGQGPCHLSMSADGRNLMTANYTSGSVAAIPVKQDGSTGAEPTSVMQHEGHGADPRRQAGPHAHSINPAPDGKHIYAADLGLDKILIYTLDTASGKLQTSTPSEAVLKAASGPRHMTFRPDGKVAYAINELDSTITVMSRNPDSGALTIIQNIQTYPADFKGTTWCAEVRLHPNGKFLYASNRGFDSIAAFAVNPQDGTIKLTGFQQENLKFPRHFNIDPTGRYCIVANQNSDSLVLFKINQDSGLLESTGRIISVGKPVFVGFLPASTGK